jgi:hypothetical protein
VSDREKPKVEAKAIDMTPAQLAAALEAQEHPDTDHLSEYLCEVCGKRQDLTEQEAFQQGWDYPPFMGMWGVLSSRTCGTCTIERTAYWHVLTKGTADIPPNHLATIKRVLAEREEHTERALPAQEEREHG